MLNSAQFMRGKQVEYVLDAFFRARGWEIRPTTAHEERVLCLGDRHFRKGERALTIEYKSGLQTAYTGNLFLETISVDTQGKPGWVHTCRADFIFYAALGNQRILVFRPETLRQALPGLKVLFRETKTSAGQNKGYNTHGVIVPLAYAEKHLAEKVILTE